MRISTMRFVWIRLFLLVRLVSAARWLEEDGENNNNNNDLSQFTVHQGTCFRIKIVGDNDDDGNSYFYNGAYRAQYTRYISFDLCSASNQCSEYVMDLDTYLEETVTYVQNMCGSCANQCRRRRLEDADEEEDGGGGNNNMYVNCNTCQSECQLLNNGNDGTDESGYLECQFEDAEDYADGDVEYYTAPQCENGQVVIGHFYDDECTIKTSTLQDEGFSYNTFQTIASIDIDCSLSDTCSDLFDNAVLCDNGYAENNDDDSKLCKAAKAASRVQTFYTKPFYKKARLVPIFFFLFLLLGGVGFLSYTYYVRHKRLHEAKIPMAELDGNDLPPVT